MALCHDRSMPLDPRLCGCNACRISRALGSAMTSGEQMPIDNLIPIAVDIIAANEFLAGSSRNELITKILQFQRYSHNEGVSELNEIDQEFVESWIHQPTFRGGIVSAPKSSTLRNRRAAVRALYRALRTVGYDVGDPTLDSKALLDRSIRTAVCSDDQIERLRHSVPVGLISSTLAVVIALAEAGATNSEIARSLGSNIDGDHLVLPGSARALPRRNPFTSWGIDVVCARLSEMQSLDQLLVATMPVRSVSNGAVSNQLRTICQFANLSHHGITVNSIRAWRAQQIVVETGSLENAARFLGSRSLDAVAQLIDYKWIQHP